MRYQLIKKLSTKNNTKAVGRQLINTHCQITIKENIRSELINTNLQLSIVQSCTYSTNK